MTYSENRSAASALRSKAPRLVLALLGAAGLWAAAAAAQAGDPSPANTDQAQTAASSPPAKPNPDDRVICKVEESLGTHLDKRVCHTKREWRQIEADDDDQMFRGRDPSITARGPQVPQGPY